MAVWRFLLMGTLIEDPGPMCHAQEMCFHLPGNLLRAVPGDKDFI